MDIEGFNTVRWFEKRSFYYTMSLLNTIRMSTKNGTIFIRLFWVIILSSFIAWLVGLIINSQGTQLDLFHGRMRDFWGDATVVTYFVNERNPYQYPGANYPPLPYLLYYVFACVSRIPDGGYPQYYYQPLWTMIFVLFLFIVLGMLWLICAKNTHSGLTIDAMMTGLSFCISGPMLYTIERGNVILVAILCTAIFVFYYDNKCRWKKEIALLSLAIAVDIKVAPAVFGALLICNKDWQAICRTLLYGILFFILPFYFFEGGINNLPLMISHINQFLNHFAYDGVVSGAGIYSVFFQFFEFLFGDSYRMSDTMYKSLRIVSYEVSFILFLGLFHFKEKWKQVLNLTIIMLIVPSVAFQYYYLLSIPVTILFLSSFSDNLHENTNDDVIGKFLIFMSFIMIYFVYRCPLSDFFNHKFAILILTVTGLFYSIKAFIKSKRILPIDFFSKSRID